MKPSFCEIGAPRHITLRVLLRIQITLADEGGGIVCVVRRDIFSILKYGNIAPGDLDASSFAASVVCFPPIWEINALRRNR
ncbi:hypothetical protein CEXT_396121 [Caerostris extrusa]|uniref:Uncharacterized protein n=1 Tax=Caerostris extrusa TaxID=172846 RepID=A0AAV4MVI7_CAEEX|nr:hypothetical protein CEXT_396121 [Caerostris extrusa]